MCVCVCVYVRECVYVYVRESVCVYVCERVCEMGGLRVEGMGWAVGGVGDWGSNVGWLERGVWFLVKGFVGFLFARVYEFNCGD